MTKEERKLQQQIAKEKNIPTKYITVRGDDWSIDPEWNKISKKRIQDKIDDLPEGTMYHLGTGKEVLDGDNVMEAVTKRKKRRSGGIMTTPKNFKGTF
tara:strand:- start:157 stop:450 length:294 start_codon:yes stop_codon:yes gene_type:complete